MSEQWRDFCITALDSKNAQDMRHFPVNCLFAEHFIVATGTSQRHLWAMSDAIEKLCKDHNRKCFVQGKHDETRWIVLDTAGVFVHLFLAEGRAYYDVENIWQSSE